MTILDSCRRPDALAQAFNSYWRLAGVRSLVAVTDGTRSLSYGELDQHTAHLAAQLRAHGVAPGDAVAVTMRRSLDAVLAVIAAIRAGACPCLMEPRLPAAEVDERLLAVGAHRVVFDTEHRALAADLHLSDATRIPFETLSTTSSSAVHVDVPADTRALLLFTSGSTGRPKAVQLSQAALLNNALGIIEHSTLSERDRLLHVMPIYHTNGLNNQLFAPLLAGSTVVFTERFRAEDMPALLEIHRPTIITGVPTMYSRMLAQRFSAAGLASLRMARCGSAPITKELHEQVEAMLGCPLIVSYGLSEATCTSTMNPPLARRIGSVGTPLRGQCVQLREADGAMTAESGREGEICIAGPNLMSGYVGADDETNRAISDGWLRTGDLGRFDDSGYLYVTGRIKDVIIRGGENLSPLLIESVIVSDARVAACCVVGREDRDLGEVPVAFIIRAPGAHVEGEEVRDIVLRRLSHIYAPHEVLFVHAFPETGVGKIDRKALTALAALN
jgi:acyl-CoA synthetase (AMP-forming)/AMP-acid ligase II